jgi:hypothetical protein
MHPRSPFVDFDDFIQRDREAEIAKIRSRRAERDQMRSVYRRRRAMAVAVLALPVAGFVFAGKFPSDNKKASATKTTRTSAAAAPVAATTADGTQRFPAPTEVRGVHFSMHLASDQRAIQKVVDAFDASSGLNAVELDVKNENGEIGFTEGMPALALSSGAAQNVYEPRLIVEQLHAAGFYVIGRVVSFEDPILAEKAPKRAIRTTDGAVWKNHAGLGWLNPYTKVNWTYLIDVAKAAGNVGFDEIQFDYVRFPTDGDLSNVKLSRTKAKMEDNIAAFLQHAVDELHPLKLRVSADLFGLAATQDLGIGQDPRRLSKIVDVMSPMIYPQGYSSGTYNIACPVCNPHDLIDATMSDWRKVAVGGTAELRPWIQAYNWIGHLYGPDQVVAQVDALRKWTDRGFLLWNATSVYQSDMLKFPVPA